MKNQKNINNSKPTITIIVIVISVILSIPFIAMQFTKEVKWSLIDFAAAGILLCSAGLAIWLVIRYVRTSTLRAVLFIVILLALFLIWAELAVGIFGSPLAGS